MSALAATPELSFTDLRDVMEMTDGNVTAHIKALHQNGYVAITKTIQAGRQHTTFSLTLEGKKAFRTYLGLLEQILQETKHFS